MLERQAGAGSGMVKLSDGCSYRKVRVADRWVGAVEQRVHTESVKMNSVNTERWTLGVRLQGFLKGEDGRKKEGIHTYGVLYCMLWTLPGTHISSNPHSMTERQIAKQYSVRIWTPHAYTTSKIYISSNKDTQFTMVVNRDGQAEAKETNLRL